MKRKNATLEGLRRSAFKKVKESARLDPMAQVKPVHRWLPNPLAVLALVVVLTFVGILYALKTPTGAQLVAASSQTAVAPTPGQAQPSAPTEELVVHVTGKVNRPGIVKLPAGARVVDAIEQAGGTLPGTDLGTLNLARPLQDGEQVVVGVTPTSDSAQAQSDLVNINTANASQLQELDGIGPALAKRIVAYRSQHGNFSSVEDLQKVSGIGPNLLARIKVGATV